MSLVDHKEILRKGVDYWNQWREDNPDIIPQLSNTDMGDVIGNIYDFSSLNLSKAYIESSSFFSLCLDNANFQGAVLQNCNCYAASFQNANFKSADLQLANFTLACLNEANFDGAYLGNTVFASCNLSSTKNLETCEHLHSSIIDHLTLIESDNLPLSFLRGCGLPDFIIDNIAVLKGDPIIFNSCFISYSSNDEEFAKKLYSDLQNSGIRCWFAPEDLRGGKKSFDQINNAIKIHEKLLVILSGHSMKSGWVATEIKKARFRERFENRLMLFPITIVPIKDIQHWELFDADSGNDLAAEIRSYHIPDFSNWKSYENYKTTFDRLIEALKRTE